MGRKTDESMGRVIGGHLANIWRLGLKELASLRADPVLVVLIIYTVTVAIYMVAKDVRTEVRNASIAIVDEDHSTLSRRLAQAFLPPYFKPAKEIGVAQLDPAMDEGKYSFVLDIPPHFQRDVLEQRNPVLQLNVDATAMTLAGNGTGYVQSIINNEIADFLDRGRPSDSSPIRVTIRSKYNPNLESSWFMSVMQIISNITMLALILSGAAVIREREHGTLEHLLVMPLMPSEIMLAKIWANGLVIVAATLISLYAVVKGLLGVEINGSVALFTLGTAIFLFAMMALGITLATIARSMPQFGLLAIPFFVVMNMLSGAITPLETMPKPLQILMMAAPSTHFTSFAQAVLYRGAGLDVVWPQLAAMALIGLVLTGIALHRFRASLAAMR